MMRKDYYLKLDTIIKRFENGTDHDGQYLSKISDKIIWYWQHKYISTEEMHELCDRITNLWETKRVSFWR